MEGKATSEYSQASVEQAFERLESSPDGLTESEARIRIGRVGFNEVVIKERSSMVDFLLRFWGPMPWLLEFTIFLSIVIGHYLEAAIIFGLLFTNASIGFLHTRGSRRALELLKKRLSVRAKVLRDGGWVIKDARELVPGDVVTVALGDLVPADCKIISDLQISVDQSALTGESLPVSLEKSAIIYSSSIVKHGEAKVLVLNTGSRTYFGRTAELVKIARPTSHQEQIMLTVVRYMMYLGVAALVIVVGDALFTQRVEPVSILSFALIFLMGAVPVALPAVFAVVLSVGAMELAGKGALVTRLDSIEDAASMEVLCLDKTGTITQNKLSIVNPIPFAGFSEKELVLYASLASKEELKDVIDLTILNYAKSLNLDFKGYNQISFVPFDPATKRSESIVDYAGKRFKVTKGAPQVITSLCNATDENLREVTGQMQKLSEQGYRTLAVAISENSSTFRFVGLLPLADPPRPDSRDMIQELRRLQVQPKMLTGDNAAIGEQIAREVGIGNKILRASDLSSMDERSQAKS